MNTFNLRQRRPPRRIRVSACVLALLSLAVLGEVYLRIFPSPAVRIQVLDHHRFRSEISAEYDPVLGFLLKKGVALQGFPHNSRGFIGPEFAVPKPEGIFRIFCLGGSTTLGAGVDSPIYSYPALLQAMFDKTPLSGGKKVEVVNGGVFGYHSLHTAIRASFYPDAYSPDACVIMDGLNDLDAVRALTLDQLSRFDAWKRLGLPSEGIPGGAYSRACAVLKRSMLFELVWGGFVSSGYERLAGYGMENIDEKFRLFGSRDNLQQAISLLREKGVVPVLVDEPMRMAPDSGKTAPASVRINSDLEALLRFGRERIRHENSALAAENKTMLVDPQKVFDGFLNDTKAVRRAWADDLHLTRYGYYLVAREVYRSLLEDKRVCRELGASGPLPDSELDRLFEGIMAWRPADGAGRISAENALDPSGITVKGAVDSIPDKDGWAFYGVDGGGTEGEITLTLDSPLKTFKVFPRILERGDSVVIEKFGANGERTELFALKKSENDDLWSPESSWYEVPVPPDGDQAGRLVIRLKGENAQLWHVGKALLFR